MKKKYVIILLALIAALSGCAKVIIPEISPNLSHQELQSLTDKRLANIMMENNSQLIFVNLDGELFRWDPKDQIVNSLVHINSEIDPNVFSQGDYVCFKQLKTGKYTLFDLKELKEITTLDSTDIKQIIGINYDLLIYLAKPNRLTVLNYRTQKPLATLKIQGKQDFYNAEFRSDRVFILSGGYFYTYMKGSDAVDMKKLKYKAASGFLLDDNVIYYGTQSRELVKMSIKSGNPSWAFKLAEVLPIKPQKIGKYIVIIPGDNNIYFFNKNGTLYWWEKLNSTRLHSPVIMKDNAAVCLWDKNIKFFNYKKKQVTTYPLGYLLRTNPVVVNEYLYVVTEEKVEDTEAGGEELVFLNLAKVGNHYGLEITTNPRYVKPMGKSVRFDIKSINLIEPQFSIKIFKNQPGEQTPVYEKVLTSSDKPSFVWIPKEAIDYRMVIAIDSENKKGLVIEQVFPALDIQQMLRNYYYEIQTQCDSNFLN